MKILLIEDDVKLLNNLTKALVRESFIVEGAETKEDGLELIFSEDYDVMIIDVNLPDGTGFELAKEVRDAKIKTPILLLTARSAVEDKVKGLNIGADDYMTKPFDFAELVARVKALLRRPTNIDDPILVVDNLSLDPYKRLVKRNGEEIILSNKEYALLEYLLRNREKVISKIELLEHVWGSQIDIETNVVDVYIGYLRKKIDKNFSTEKPLVKTIRGMGYKIG